MADEPSNRELGHRLDDIREAIRGLVSRAEYDAHREAAGYRFAELAHDIAEEQRARERDVWTLRDENQALRAELEKREQSRGARIRERIYQGLIPASCVAATLLVTILLALKGGH